MLVKTIVNGQQVTQEVPEEIPNSIIPLTDMGMSPRSFFRFIATHGYDDTIRSVLAAAKGANADLYAQVYGDFYGAREYRLSSVLGFLTSPDLAEFLPDGFELSEETLSQQWADFLSGSGGAV